jgi:hypothetical protein
VSTHSLRRGCPSSLQSEKPYPDKDRSGAGGVNPAPTKGNEMRPEAALISRHWRPDQEQMPHVSQRKALAGH